MQTNKTMGRSLMRWMVPIALLLMAALFIGLPETASAATERPDQVTVIRAEASFDSVTLTWKASRHATDYIIYRAKSKYGLYKQIAATEKTAYRDTKLPTGKAQWYKIRAVNDGKRSWKSPRISAVPMLSPPVMNVSATGEGIYLSLKKVDGADGYLIYRDGKFLSNQKALSYLDEKIYSGKQHKYKAIAYRFVENKVVPSEFSKETTAVRPSISVQMVNAKKIPAEVHETEPFEFRGIIKSNTTMQKVVAGITNKEDGKWVKGFRFSDKTVNSMNFDLSAINEKVKVEELEQGTYCFKIDVTLKTGSEKTIQNLEFAVIQPPGGTMIVNTATELAWPKGTSRGTYKYPSGHATDAYRAGLSQAYGSRSGWSSQTKAGASCDVFVGTVVRVSGYDTGFPRGLDEVESYCKSHSDKWEDTGITSDADLQPGDVLYQLYKGGGGHVAIYLGDGLVANAHYHGKAFGVVQDMHNGGGISRHSWKTYKVFRPIQ